MPRGMGSIHRIIQVAMQLSAVLYMSSPSLPVASDSDCAGNSTRLLEKMLRRAPDGKG